MEKENQTTKGTKNMDVKEFQEKLAEVLKVAQANENMLSREQMREIFKGMDLSRQQLVKIVQYLKGKGIFAEGMETEAESSADAAVQEEPERAKVPLTAAEKAYLKSYLESLQGNAVSAKTQEELWAAWEKGEESSREELTAFYMPVAAQMAADMNCEEIPLADLIQEATLVLLTALGTSEREGINDAWLRGEIEKGIRQVIGEQTERNLQDEYLVEKVQKLDTAIRELSEDEEEISFDIGELSVLLDMKVEEIRNVLWLTGEEQ